MPLPAKDLRLARLFTAIVIGNWQEVRRQRAAAPAGEPDRAWRECVLQTHLFAGYPRLVQAFGVLAEEGGLGQAEAQEFEGPTPIPDPSGAVGRGRELFDRIYGDGSDKVRGLLHDYHADFADWILGHAYGRVLARPGLEAAQRELLASCALAALGQERQLASHARGSLRCGATHEELMCALEGVADLMPAENWQRARRLVERFSDGPPSR